MIDYSDIYISSHSVTWFFLNDVITNKDCSWQTATPSTEEDNDYIIISLY